MTTPEAIKFKDIVVHNPQNASSSPKYMGLLAVSCVVGVVCASPALPALTQTIGTLFAILGMTISYLKIIYGSASAPVSEQGSIRATPDELYINGNRLTVLLHRKELTEGVLTEFQGDPAVNITCNDLTSYTFTCPDEATAKKLLSLLGLDASRRRYRAELPASWWQLLQSFFLGLFFFLLLAMLMPLTPFRGEKAFVMVTALSLFASFLFARRVAPVVTVGADGIQLQQGLGPPVFLPYSALRSIEQPDGDLVRFHKTDGTHVDLWRSRTEELAVETLIKRIEQARQAPATTEQAYVAQLDPDGRSYAQWVEKLRSLTQTQGSYRGGHTDKEALRSVVADRHAPATQRLGAAIVLCLDGSAEEQQRVRVAVENCADEKLRNAMLLAAEQKLDEETASEVLTAAQHQKR